MLPVRKIRTTKKEQILTRNLVYRIVQHRRKRSIYSEVDISFKFQLLKLKKYLTLPVEHFQVQINFTYIYIISKFK